MLSYRKQGACIVLAVMMLWLFAPNSSRAQLYLSTDIGRVMHSMNASFLNINPLVRGSDYKTNARAGKFYYPQDEWVSGNIFGYWPMTAIEQVLHENEPAPMEKIFHSFGTGGNAGWPNRVNRTPFVFQVTARHRPPLVMVGPNQIPIQPDFMEPSGIVDPHLPLEQNVIVSVSNFDGYRLTSTHWATPNKNLDRSVIHHWNMLYDGITSDPDAPEVTTLPAGQVLTYWFGHHWNAQIARSKRLWGVTANAWGDKRQKEFTDYMEAPSRLLNAGDAPRAANLQIFYTSDGSAPDIQDWNGDPLDDTGSPLVGPAFARTQEAETGEFVADRIIGSAVFHSDRSPDDPSDFFHLTDLTQNAPGSFFTRRCRLTNFGAWENNVPQKWALHTVTGEFQKSAKRQYFESMGVNTNGLEWSGVTEAAVAGAPVVSAAERNLGTDNVFLTSGPYTISPNQEHDYIFTFAVGDLPNRESIDLGARYLTWLAQERPGQHPNGEGTGLTPLTNLEKFMVLEGVKDTLFRVIDNSFYAWHGGTNSGLTIEQKKDGVGMDRMPDAPPSPDVLVRGGPERNEVYAWYPDEAMFADHDTGVDDFVGWRVYRKQGRPDVNEPTEIKDFGYLEWELVGTVTATGSTGPTGQSLTGSPALGTDHYNDEFTLQDGTTRRVFRFLDPNVSSGKDYFYAVTGFDDGSQNLYGVNPGESIEGSRFQTASSGIAVTPFTPGLQVTTEVVVVPNPWMLDGGASRFGGIDPNKILFDKLPRLCKLKIYTETGDLIQTIEHTDQSAQEVWFQETISNQLVVSGIYILAVLEAKEVDPATNEVLGNLPDQFVKFVVIR
jgi:hypothetical protein